MYRRRIHGHFIGKRTMSAARTMTITIHWHLGHPISRQNHVNVHHGDGRGVVANGRFDMSLSLAKGQQRFEC